MAEKTEWRECEFGGPETIIPVGDGPSRYCEARSYGPRNGKLKMHVYVCPEGCATCPVPALVAAVKESRDTLHTMRKPHSIGTDAEDMCEAALALLPKEESRG